MTASEVLAEAFSQVRGYTLNFLKQAPDSVLLWTPPTLRNHIIWRAGHALWGIDLLVIQTLTGATELPPGWASLFCEGSIPQPGLDWPDRNALLQKLDKQRSRVLEVLADLDPVKLSQPAEGFSARRNLGGWILHAIHDEAMHQGESFLIIKMQAAIKSGS